ncbi:MAG: transglycosylase domain-containing protein [Clostridia bacterium]|nr:transglycosylase domain-containing protein [Clostridia bacterium]
MKILYISLIIIVIILLAFPLAAGIYAFFLAARRPIKKLYEKRKNQTDFEALSDIPDVMVRYIILSEDADFYKHRGVIPGAVKAAIKLNFRKKRIITGGSTITQQLVKNLYFNFEHSYFRKLVEIFLSLYVESILGKEEILEFYFNIIYFGNGVYGIADAARFYFGRQINDLSNNQFFILACIPQAPTAGNPIQHPQAFVRCRDNKINNLFRLGVLSEEEKRAFLSHSIECLDPDLRKNDAFTSAYPQEIVLVNEKYGPQKKDKHYKKWEGRMYLSNENIQKAVKDSDAFLERNGIDRQTRLRYRLLIEENLLDYANHEANADFEIKMITKDRKIRIVITVEGESLNPLEKSESEITAKLVEDSSSIPSWKYKNGKNIITYSAKPVAPDFKSVKYLLGFMTRRKKEFVIASILRFVNMGLNVLEPLLAAQIIVAYSGSEFRKIFIIAALILAQAVSSAIVNYAASFMLRKSYSYMVKEMQKDLTENVLHIKTACMDATGSGLFTQRLINETADAVDRIDDLLGSVTELFRLISLFISFAVVSPKMLVFELVLFIIYVIIQRFHMRSVTDDGRRYRTANEKHTSFVSEMVRAHRDIKLLNCEQSFMQKLKMSVEESVDLFTKMRVNSMRFIFLRQQFVGVTNFIYMALLALFMIKDGMLPSTALVLYNYNGSVYTCSTSVSQMMTTVYNLALSSERIYQLMHSSDYETEVFGDTHLETVKGDIELRNVHFSYKNSNGNVVKVLNGINLHIREGERVAFVGRSGCGKSTLLSLISRLHDPDRGEILLDGHDLRELDKETLRGNMEMVSQMPYIFNMSIRENLAVAKNDATEEEMARVCKLACIYDDIMDMPNGFDTVVGEGGVTLSGGQRQRVALARSLLQEHSILMLDEATSALDNITQSKIQAAIDGMQGRQTTLMVAHRLSTVINCEHIFFISGGKVLADGTHAELLRCCPEYRELYSQESA